METFNASELCKPHKRKLSHFLDNQYVKDFMQSNGIEPPKMQQGRGHQTKLDVRLKTLLEWWLNSGYKNPTK